MAAPQWELLLSHFCGNDNETAKSDEALKA